MVKTFGFETANLFFIFIKRIDILDFDFLDGHDSYILTLAMGFDLFAV